MTAPTLTLDLDRVEAAAKAAALDATYWRQTVHHLAGLDAAPPIDLAHIAACSPAVVLAMCARLRWAEAVWFEIGVLMKHEPSAATRFPRLAALLAERTDRDER